MIDDHFWPAVYPGVIVGVMVGLAVVYSFASGLIGAIAGLAGAFLAQLAVDRLGVQNDFLRLAVLVAAAAIAAYVAVRTANSVRRGRNGRTER